MKKILMLECGLKPGWTKKTADKLGEELGKNGEFELDRVNLREERIEQCMGCGLCIGVNEEKCKNHDDAAAKILAKMLWADGIIIVTPNYALNIPANLKNVYDRLAFVFHRPRLFGRTFMPITVQGVYGGGKINKYMNEVMRFWGCHTLKGTVIQGGLYPRDELPQKMLDKNDEKIQKAAGAFLKDMTDSRQKTPSLFQVMIFRMTRTGMKASDYPLQADKQYYTDNGWLESKYYYDVKLGPVHALVGAIGEGMAKGGSKKS